MSFVVRSINAHKDPTKRSILQQTSKIYDPLGMLAPVTIRAKLLETEERVALRKQGLNEKTAASVLLKLFISGNERCHTTDAP